MTLRMSLFVVFTAAISAAVPVPASAQLGDFLRKAEQEAQQRKQQFDDVNITEEEEIALGAEVSARIRERFGVVQDPAVHEYVALVGTVLTEHTTRTGLPWTFIVLDTDGVNAFATPGGYVHITRGALALIRSEAELAGVLGHEISHVVRKHTVNAIQKSKGVDLGTRKTLSSRGEYLDTIATQTYGTLLQNSFDRGDELDADREGVLLVQKAGYVGTGLADFLTRLAERNKNHTDKNGLFASHPETDERIIKTLELAGGKAGVLVEARYRSTIKYPPTDVTQVAVIVEGAAGVTGDKNAKPAPKPAEEPRRRGFGLGTLSRAVTGEKPSQQVAASGGARGVGTDGQAKGGTNPNTVATVITPLALATFKLGIV
ncbi:MAG: M48 family metalloprotease [Acidobacteria bacterium]|nr:M48 family metalloprotease [Acidobacteriota bacterium]